MLKFLSDNFKELDFNKAVDKNQGLLWINEVRFCNGKKDCSSIINN